MFNHYWLPNSSSDIHLSTTFASFPLMMLCKHSELICLTLDVYASSVMHYVYGCYCVMQCVYHIYCSYFAIILLLWVYQLFLIYIKHVYFHTSDLRSKIFNLYATCVKHYVYYCYCVMQSVYCRYCLYLAIIVLLWVYLLFLICVKYVYLIGKVGIMCNVAFLIMVSLFATYDLQQKRINDTCIHMLHEVPLHAH